MPIRKDWHFIKANQNAIISKYHTGNISSVSTFVAVRSIAVTLISNAGKSLGQRTLLRFVVSQHSVLLVTSREKKVVTSEAILGTAVKNVKSPLGIFPFYCHHVTQMPL